MAAPTVHRRQLLSAALLGLLLGIALAAAVPAGEQNSAGGRKLAQTLFSVDVDKEDGEKTLDIDFGLPEISITKELSNVAGLALGPLGKSFSFDTDTSGLPKSVSVTSGGRKLSQISIKSEKEDGKKSFDASFKLPDFSGELSKVFDASLGPFGKSFSFDTDSSGLSKSVSVSSGSSSPSPPPAKPPAAKSPAPPAAKPPAPPAPKAPAGGGGDGVVINIVNSGKP